MAAETAPEPEVVVRGAVLADVPGIAEVHVESWHATYPGIFPDEVIGSYTVENRTAQWTRSLTQRPPRSGIVVAEAAGRIVGFASTGPFRGDATASTDGELYAIYLRRSAQGRGVGRRLFDAAVKSLRDAGFPTTRCWVVDGNPAVGFYERVGGLRVASQPFEAGGLTLTEHGYLFDLRALRT